MKGEKGVIDYELLNQRITKKIQKFNKLLETKEQELLDISFQIEKIKSGIRITEGIAELEKVLDTEFDIILGDYLLPDDRMKISDTDKFFENTIDAEYDGKISRIKLEETDQDFSRFRDYISKYYFIERDLDEDENLIDLNLNVYETLFPTQKSRLRNFVPHLKIIASYSIEEERVKELSIGNKQKGNDIFLEGIAHSQGQATLLKTRKQNLQKREEYDAAEEEEKKSIKNKRGFRRIKQIVTLSLFISILAVFYHFLFKLTNFDQKRLVTSALESLNSYSVEYSNSMNLGLYFEEFILILADEQRKNNKNNIAFIAKLNVGLIIFKRTILKDCFAKFNKSTNDVNGFDCFDFSQGGRKESFYYNGVMLEYNFNYDGYLIQMNTSNSTDVANSLLFLQGLEKSYKDIYEINIYTNYISISTNCLISLKETKFFKYPSDNNFVSKKTNYFKSATKTIKFHAQAQLERKFAFINLSSFNDNHRDIFLFLKISTYIVILLLSFQSFDFHKPLSTNPKVKKLRNLLKPKRTNKLYTEIEGSRTEAELLPINADNKGINCDYRIENGQIQIQSKYFYLFIRISSIFQLFAIFTNGLLLYILSLYEQHDLDISALDLDSEMFLNLGPLRDSEILNTNLSALVSAFFMICLGDFFAKINSTIQSYMNAMIMLIKKGFTFAVIIIGTILLFSFVWLFHALGEIQSQNRMENTFPLFIKFALGTGFLGESKYATNVNYLAYGVSKTIFHPWALFLTYLFYSFINYIMYPLLTVRITKYIKDARQMEQTKLEEENYIKKKKQKKKFIGD